MPKTIIITGKQQKLVNKIRFDLNVDCFESQMYSCTLSETDIPKIKRQIETYKKMKSISSSPTFLTLYSDIILDLGLIIKLYNLAEEKEATSD